jgi:hypothetical protein
VGYAALEIGGRGLLVRVGVASVATGSAGLTLVFSLCVWMMLGGEPAFVETRVQVTGVSAFGTIHWQLPRLGTAVLPADVPSALPARFASLSNATFESRWATDDSSDTTPAPSPFGDRFASESPAPRAPSLLPSWTFSDRFAGAIASGAPPARLALASVPATFRPARSVAPAPHAAARALIARVAPNKREERAERPAVAPYRVASLGDTPIRTAYASADTANRDAAIDDSLLKTMTPRDPAPQDAATNPDMSHTAIYDITGHMVYLPNGRRLEAHSGLGEHMDDLGSISLRDLGPTPPGVYDLTMREASFHGIDAIRLNPLDNGKMHGRDGILAHPYMLGPNGQSNGCLSLKDYDAFLAAFHRGEFNRLLVVERLGDAPGGQTATGWIADKLRALFGRS